MTSLRVVEDIVEHESRPAGDLLLREDFRTQGEDLLRAGQPEVVDQEADVLGVPPPCGKHLHGQQMFRRRRRHPQARMVEDARSRRVASRSEYPCLISLNVERELFAQLVLAQVRPEVCLRHLNALVSPHPYELEPIPPILDFDLTKFSFVDGLDAVSTLDSRPDLMKMSPTEFEHLVRQIFEAVGVESWTTEQNYDDGVDASSSTAQPYSAG